MFVTGKGTGWHIDTCRFTRAIPYQSIKQIIRQEHAQSKTREQPGPESQRPWANPFNTDKDQIQPRKRTEVGEGKKELSEKINPLYTPQFNTIVVPFWCCKFDFANSKQKTSLVWENPVNSNVCVGENKCISLSPSTCLNCHHIPQFGYFSLMSVFTGYQHLTESFWMQIHPPFSHWLQKSHQESSTCWIPS